MNEISLCVMTRELCREFFAGFVRDPALCADMSAFVPYEYSEEKADRYFDAQQEPSRVAFMIMKDGHPIGEVKLKHIDRLGRQCTIDIHMRSDEFKGQGYGTAATRLALEHAFFVLGMDWVNADAIHKNLRSQHILQKLGFRFLREDEMFRYYRIGRSFFCTGQVADTAKSGQE